MATDATGTPTPLGIPTFNVNADAPSGNGFNAAMAAIDALIQSTSALVAPVGSVTAFAGASAPSGWLLADGSAVSRTTYSALYAAISTTYGSGDGSTTFNLPDLRGRVPVGQNAGTFASLGATGGEETHVISQAEMPSHTHTGTTGTESAGHTHLVSGQTGVEGNPHSHTYSVPAFGNIANGSTATGATGTVGATTSTESANHAHSVSITSQGVSAAHTHSFTTAATGSGSAHNNLQPYLVLNHIIKH